MTSTAHGSSTADFELDHSRSWINAENAGDDLVPGDLVLPGHASRLLTASGRISPGLDPGSYYIHLHTTNDLKNDPIEFCNINLEITG